MKEKVAIFVLDRGFVVVGLAKVSEEIYHHWHMRRSVTVRHWGTTQGLAELQHGPTSQTELDQVCERRPPFRSIIDIIIPTEEGAQKWLAILNAPSSSPQRKQTNRES